MVDYHRCGAFGFRPTLYVNNRRIALANPFGRGGVISSMDQISNFFVSGWDELSVWLGMLFNHAKSEGEQVQGTPDISCTINSILFTDYQKVTISADSLYRLFSEKDMTPTKAISVLDSYVEPNKSVAVFIGRSSVYLYTHSLDTVATPHNSISFNVDSIETGTSRVHQFYISTLDMAERMPPHDEPCYNCEDINKIADCDSIQEIDTVQTSDIDEENEIESGHAANRFDDCLVEDIQEICDGPSEDPDQEMEEITFSSIENIFAYNIRLFQGSHRGERKLVAFRSIADIPGMYIINHEIINNMLQRTYIRESYMDVAVRRVRFTNITVVKCEGTLAKLAKMMFDQEKLDGIENELKQWSDGICNYPIVFSEDGIPKLVYIDKNAKILETEEMYNFSFVALPGVRTCVPIAETIAKVYASEVESCLDSIHTGKTAATTTTKAEVVDINTSIPTSPISENTTGAPSHTLQAELSRRISIISNRPIACAFCSYLRTNEDETTKSVLFECGHPSVTAMAKAIPYGEIPCSHKVNIVACNTAICVPRSWDIDSLLVRQLLFRHQLRKGIRATRRVDCPLKELPQIVTGCTVCPHSKSVQGQCICTMLSEVIYGGNNILENCPFDVFNIEDLIKMLDINIITEFEDEESNDEDPDKDVTLHNANEEKDTKTSEVAIHDAGVITSVDL